ncbi:MAG: hypothetical protein NZ553_19760 [Caldilinea sp.]|nr:hypothetical protein [Caldilinea sp.]MDW8442720.1 hypothetical protein [Caldilineaceae bacterium]
MLTSLGVGGVILEATSSFPELGVRPPTPSWGTIFAGGRAHLLRHLHIALGVNFS